MNGKILIAPIEGSGTFTATVGKSNVKYVYYTILNRFIKFDPKIHSSSYSP